MQTSNPIPEEFPARVLVLGCDGFIGHHLVRRLLSFPEIEVVGWDRCDRRMAAFDGNPRFTFRLADIASDWSRLGEDIARGQVVVNLAALCNPSLYGSRTLDVIRSNFTDVEPVVRLCAESGVKLVHLSTCEVFGRTLRSWLPDQATDLPGELDVLDEDKTPFLLGPLSSTRWSYACAKQLSERLIEAWGRERGLQWTIVRPFNFIGPGMDYLPGRDGEGVPRVLACFMKALIDREPLRLVNGGFARRTFLHISEAVEALVRILERPESTSQQVIHLGNAANETDIRGLAVAMREIWARLRGDPSIFDLAIESISAEDFYGPGYDDSDRRVLGMKKAHTLLGWAPILSLKETLELTMQDYHERYPETQG
jgi:UDP-apiose/xylose synthase